jgi:hypothetical protein
MSLYSLTVCPKGSIPGLQGFEEDLGYSFRDFDNDCDPLGSLWEDDNDNDHQDEGRFEL